MMIHILLIISIISISGLEWFTGNSSLNFHIINTLILAHKKGCNPSGNNEWGKENLQISGVPTGFPEKILSICLRLMFLQHFGTNLLYSIQYKSPSTHCGWKNLFWRWLECCFVLPQLEMLPWAGKVWISFSRSQSYSWLPAPFNLILTELGQCIFQINSYSFNMIIWVLKLSLMFPQPVINCSGS